MKILDEKMFERALARACEEDLERELAELDKVDIEKEVHFSRRHKRIMKYILAHGCKPPPRVVTFRMVMRKISACFAIVMALSLCSCVCFPAVRAGVAEFIVAVYDDYLGIGDGGDSVITHAMEHHAPTYIPEWYELKEDSSEIYWGRILYESKNGTMILYSQHFNKHATWYFDSEGAMLSDVFVDEYKGKYLEYTEEEKAQNIIMWTDGYYTYYIMGELPYEELKAMAESVS